MRSIVISIVTFLIICASGITPIRAESPTAVYTDAVETMKSLKLPPEADYRTSIVAQGMKFSLIPYDGEMQFAVGYGREMKSSDTFAAKFTAADDRVLIDQGGSKTPVRLPLFNPTWSGISQWMRYGFYGPAGEGSETTGKAQSPLPFPSPTSTSEELQTIGVVRAIDPGGYDITDGGQSSCPGAAPGHRLRLRAYRDAETHPLTSVVIDVSSSRFCVMNFQFGKRSAMSFTGAFELHLGSVGTNWLITDGIADFTLRAFGISTQHSHIVFRNSDFVLGDSEG